MVWNVVPAPCGLFLSTLAVVAPLTWPVSWRVPSLLPLNPFEGIALQSNLQVPYRSPAFERFQPERSKHRTVAALP